MKNIDDKEVFLQHQFLKIFVSNKGTVINWFGEQIGFLHKGYPCIGNPNRNKTQIRIHNLVYSLFGDRQMLGKEINHIDGNKENNSIHNLEPVTHAENMRHAANIGLIKNYQRGEDRPASKLNSDDVLLIRFIGSSLSHREIARMFSIDKAVVGRILKFTAWKHV